MSQKQPTSSEMVRQFHAYCRDTLSDLDEGLRKISEDAAVEVQKKLKSQTVHDVKPEYKKTVESVDEYIENIESIREGEGRYRVGTDADHAEVSRVTEYGDTRGIPARPHYRPVLRILRTKVEALVKSLGGAR